MEIKQKCCIDKQIKFSEEHMKFLKEKFNTETVNFQEESDAIESCDVALLHSFLPDSNLKKMKKCKFIGIRAHNTDYINKVLAGEIGINFSGIDQKSARSVAEHTITLIFALAKKLILLHENTVSGKWRAGIDLNMDLFNKKIGIIGYGQIGKTVAEIAKGIGMEVLISSKSDNPGKGELPLDEVLSKADIISVHLPSRENTQKFIDREKISKMKDGVIFINTSRGSLADYEALEEAIKSGKIYAAGLDVYPDEPVKESPLFRYPNVICTPHLAFYTKETLEAMNAAVIDKLFQFQG